jgi:hypothetical protein
MRIAALLMLVVPALIFAQDRITPGSFKGVWSGMAGGGDFNLTVRADGQGGLGADIKFTVEGQDVPSKITSIKVSGASIEAVYEFDLQGNKLQSAMKGTLKSKTLEGTYKTTAGDSPVDEGTWKTTAQ